MIDQGDMGGWTFLNDSLWRMALLSVVSGGPNPTLLAHLGSELKLAKPSVVGLASAYVSVVGAHELLQIFNSLKTKECRLLAGISNSKAPRSSRANYFSVE